MRLRRASVPAWLILSAPLAALGQSAPADYVLIGAGLRARPAYDGAAAHANEAIPVLRYYGKPWFARTTQGVLEGGARIEPGSGFALGAQVVYEGGRSRSESAFLKDHNVDDIGVGASLGVHAELDRSIGSMPVPRHGLVGAVVGNRRHLVSGDLPSAARPGTDLASEEVAAFELGGK